MSSFKPGRFLSDTSKVSEKSQSKDLETIVSQIEKGLQELKEFLKTETPEGDPKKEPDSHVYVTRLSDAGKEVAERSKPTENHPLPHNWVKFAVTPMEAEAIIDRVGKFDQESRVMERLAKVERQNRRLTIFSSIFLSLMLLSLLFAGYLWWQTHPSDKDTSLPMAKGLIPATPTKELSPPPPVVTATPQPRETLSPAPEHLAKPAESLPGAGPPKAQATSPSTRTTPASQGASALVRTPKAPETPAIKYVGSISSNKYHYPDCKWARTIIPRKLWGFASVEEAKKAGYIPCPTCKPPLMDHSDSQAMPPR